MHSADHPTGPATPTDSCHQRALDVAIAAPGFMPPAEGQALLEAARTLDAPAHIVEIGTYCAKSTIYLALGVGTTGHITTIDHHRGSEEHQVGWAYRDETLVDDTGQLDTLPTARTTLRDAGVEDQVVLMVGTSERCAHLWHTPVDALFLDGSHTEANAHADYNNWAPWVRVGGLLLIHDVFEHPEEGGQAPFTVWQTALASGHYTEHSRTGSLRILRKTS